MTTNHSQHEESNAEIEVKAEPLVQESNNETALSFKISRNTLIMAALVILVIISSLEAIELNRIHKALQAWQKLPAAAAGTSNVPASSGGNTLPSQVGGC